MTIIFKKANCVRKRMDKRGILLIGIFVMFILVVGVASALEPTVCCERTTGGAYCQNAPEAQCDNSLRSSPSSCEATSFCKMGFCYDSQQGTCDENTPQKLCEVKGGVWEEESEDGSVPAQCELGCCLIGDQAAYVTQTRCKKLSAVYGLETDFRASIQDEVSCIALSQTAEKGACVREIAGEKTCTMTTRPECAGAPLRANSSETAEVQFYVNTLCSSEELGTNCGPSEKTTCIDGKDEVYFLDTCGNVANIYDAAKIKDKSYWAKIVDKDDSCAGDKNNA